MTQKGLFLKELKGYLVIDYDDDDEMLGNLLIPAGETYLKNAGITQDYENALYRLALILQVGINYEHRNAAMKMDYSTMFRSTLAQLKN
jgi:uncharacterized phage protein (predicted DNA packaging)